MLSHRSLNSNELQTICCHYTVLSINIDFIGVLHPTHLTVVYFWFARLLSAISFILFCQYRKKVISLHVHTYSSSLLSFFLVLCYSLAGKSGDGKDTNENFNTGQKYKRKDKQTKFNNNLIRMLLTTKIFSLPLGIKLTIQYYKI